MPLFIHLSGFIYLLLGSVSCIEEMTVREGDRVVLPCGLEGPVHWLLDENRVTDNSRRYIKGTDLVISRALHDHDQGTFSCSPVGNSGLIGGTVNIKVIWLGESATVSLVGEKPTKAGGTLQLHCNAHGTEPVSIQWFRNGDGLKSNGKIVVSGKELKVINVNPLDNGVYRCLASNQAGTIQSANTEVMSVPGEQWALIQRWPEDVLVVKGGDARLDCVYKYADVTEWYFKQTGPLENTTHYSVLVNGSLIIHKASKKDEGLYSCVGIRGESTEVPQVFTAYLSIAYLGEVGVSQLEPEGGLTRVVADGGSLEIGCVPPPSLPKPTIAWSGHHLAGSGVPAGSGDPASLLSLAGLRRTANYTCTASNFAGTSSITIQVIVTKAPQIIQEPVSLLVDEGDNAVFRCNFMANMKLSEVLWLKDGQVLKGKHSSKGFLNLTSVEPADRGIYACQITTPPHPSLISRAATLNVIEKLKFSPRPVNKVLELDTVKKIHCKAQGSTPPTVRWVKGDMESSDFPEHITDVNGTLHFSPVSVEDKGKYTCIASNPQGTINATIDIDVVVSPRFVVLPKNPTDAFEGYPVLMDCVAEGDPKPAIHWDKNSVMDNMDKTRFQVLENGSLLIEEASTSDEGKYGCTAGNSGGLKRYEVSLVVRGVEGYRVSDANEEEGVLSKTVAITLGAAGAYMVLVIGLMAYCRCRNQRKKQHSLSTQPDSLSEAGHSGEMKRCNGDAKHSDGEATAHSHCSSSSKNGKLAITRDDLNNMMLLGSGIYGEVKLAKVRDSVVLVKALAQTRDEEVLQEFRRELDLFSRIDHINVTKMLGLCQDAEPHYMILQYTDWGDLKQMLLATKRGNEARVKPPELSEKVMLSLCHQIALGMEHISNHRLVHRDLATRNCLITSDLSVKLSLVSLCKDTYAKEYALHRNKLIPIRWQPFEVVSEDDYSVKSDVYSYAATVWEIFSGGDMPLSNLSDVEVLTSLEEGRPPWTPPENCPQSLNSTLQQCWSTSPTLRPTFSAVALQMSELLKSE